MGRAALALLSMASLVFAAVAGPSTHVHHEAADASGHHRGRVMHAHAGGHHAHAAPGPEHPAVSAAPDHDGVAHALNAFQMVAGWGKPDLGVMPAIVAPAAVPVRLVHLRPPVQRGHDPPSTRLDSPRAPPSLLS